MTSFEDQELEDSLAVARDVIRAIESRWRIRIQAGRLGSHPQTEALRLVNILDAALQQLGSEASKAKHRWNSGKHEERFRQLVDSLGDYAILMLGPDGLITTWNSGAESIHGYRAEEVLGKHYAVLYPHEDVQSGKAAVELELAARNGRLVQEGWRVRRDGGRFWAHVTITALRNADNGLTGFATVTRDISELRATSEALRQSEERFRVMVEAVRDYAIFMLDVHGNITSWNRGAERLKGYKPEEIIGKHFSLFYSEEDRSRGHCLEELRIAKAEGHYEEEGWRFRKDGSRFWANVVITALFDQEGRHIGFTKVTRDFTEARRLREAQLAIQVRDEFLAVAGHELRTPLAALLMQVQSLARKVPPEDVRLKQRLEKAATAGLRLEKLIGQMLDVSRITAGRLTLEPAHARLDSIVQEVAERFAELADESRCQVSLKLDAVDGTWDRARIEQVATNLVTNALKYGQGQPIEIETRAEGDEAIMRVSDHGIGISLADQKRIFDRFERAQNAREYGGFGLGLWIAKHIVQASGGQINVESEPGMGSTFTVRLPRQLGTHNAESYQS